MEGTQGPGSAGSLAESLPQLSLCQCKNGPLSLVGWDWRGQVTTGTFPHGGQGVVTTPGLACQSLWNTVHSSQGKPRCLAYLESQSPSPSLGQSTDKEIKGIFNHFIGQWLKTKALGVMGSVLWLLSLLLRGRHRRLLRASLRASLGWRIKHSDFSSWLL